MTSKRFAPGVALPKSLQWKKVKDELAREDEESLRFSEYWNRRLLRSRVSNPKSRADPLLDREILQQIAKKVRGGAQIGLTSLAARPVPHVGTTSTPKLKRSKKTKGGYQKRLRRAASLRITKIVGGTGLVRYMVQMPNWDHVSSVIKRVAYGSAIPAPLRHTINLRLSEQVMLDALKSPKGFAGYMQDRIYRHLRNEFGPGARVPNFVIGLEGAHGLDPFHIHGAIEVEPGHISLEGRPQVVGPERSRVARALRKAGGDFPEGSRARQLLLADCYDVAGWFSYIGKYRLVTARALAIARGRLGLPALAQQESMIGVTAVLRRTGKDWYRTALTSGAFVLRNERSV